MPLNKNSWLINKNESEPVSIRALNDWFLVKKKLKLKNN